jgi:predicted MPP superfamily phosphohydrolase
VARSSLVRILLLLVFLAGSVALCFAMHYYLWVRLVRDAALPPPWGSLGAFALAGVAFLGPIGIALRREMRTGIAGNYIKVNAPPESASVASPAGMMLRPVVWASYYWMGASFILFMIVVLADLVRVLGASFAHESGIQARGLSVAAAVVSLVLVLLATRGGFRSPALTRLRVALARWPTRLDGFTIVQISDLHVGPTFGRDRVEALVARVNALEPDLIAITGDLVDGSVGELRDSVAPLRSLKAKHGSYFVTGNHDYYSGAKSWIAEISNLGIRVLRNERVSIGDDMASFDLAGIDDAQAHHFYPDHGADLARAVAGRDSARELILLAHQPKQLRDAVKHGVGLQLSGHTHGGQIWPFGWLVRLVQPYVSGFHRPTENTQLYVSFGAGHWGPPMRLGAPAEIVQITLSRRV